MNAHSYPFGPAEGHTDTSRDAAASVAKITGPIRRMVFHAIAEVGRRGLTSYELADRLRMSHSTVQPRTSELRKLGAIRDSGQRRENASGHRAIVWIAGGVA